jgi:MFS transporter, ACS family, D-galactonate transporter
VVLVIVGFSFPAVAHTLGPAVLGEITPAGQRGAVLAMNVAFVTLAGLIAPMPWGVPYRTRFHRRRDISTASSPAG